MTIAGAVRSRAIPLFAGRHQTFVARRVAGVGLKNAVAALEVSTPRDGFVRRSGKAVWVLEEDLSQRGVARFNCRSGLKR
jgi:hypothetical protein